ncbi:MAG: alcohol dehydrogenase catalytic domain-containing protein [Opitutales bacterium]|nr:alcohol dehydrogenase catalytic domain-containing protein [Opitutales bacterium]MCH8539937.1 alcohol dehydrogenase catalytic domain-containing protein [Opitutales bacterium]
MKILAVESYGQNAELSLLEAPESFPGRGEVKIQVEAVGLNPVDAYILSGNYALRPELPFVPAFDGAGEIVECGAGVSEFEVGQKVFFLRQTPGAAASRVVLPVDSVALLPEGLSVEEGACLGIPYATAQVALKKVGSWQPTDSVFIHGATGAVGGAAIDWLEYWRDNKNDAHPPIIASAGSKQGLERLLRRPSVSIVDHRDPEHLQQAAQFGNGEGIDLIVEMNAHWYLGKLPGLLAKEGRVVVVGNQGNAVLNARDLMVRHGSICGVFLFMVGAAERKRILSKIASAPAGTWNPEVREAVPFAQAGKAFRGLAAGETHPKWILKP